MAERPSFVEKPARVKLSRSLRMILDGITKTMELVLSIQEELQTRIVESFFPAQD